MCKPALTGQITELQWHRDTTLWMKHTLLAHRDDPDKRFEIAQHYADQLSNFYRIGISPEDAARNIMSQHYLAEQRATQRPKLNAQPRVGGRVAHEIMQGMAEITHMLDENKPPQDLFVTKVLQPA